MLGHLSQRDPLAASGDEDRDPRPLDRPRFQRRCAHAEVSAGPRCRGITPEPAQGPDRLIHHLLALTDTAQRDPHLLEFVFVIAHAQPDHQAAVAQRIDVGAIRASTSGLRYGTQATSEPSRMRFVTPARAAKVIQQSGYHTG